MDICVQTSKLYQEYGPAEAYRLIHEAGFTGVDWNLHTWKFDDVKNAEKKEGLCIFEKSLPEILAHYDDELTEIRRYGLKISQMHAGFGDFTSDRPDLLEYAIGIYQNTILLADAVGCPHLVIHGISMHECDDEIDAQKMEELNFHLYESLIPTLLKTNVVVCLENLFVKVKRPMEVYAAGCCTNPYQAVDWIDRLNEKAGKTCFALCLDTGHLHLMRQNFRSYIPVLGHRIVALHLHDNSQDYDFHVMPYAGTTRWSEFLSEMKKIGYSYDISFETFRHVEKSHTPPQLVPTFLRTIREIGEYFRAEIE